VLDDVRYREIICEEKIFETSDAEDNQNAHGHSGVARAFYQKRIARANGEDSADYSIRRTDECQKQCE
jgi:hypothetical protein